jgi:adenosylcobinamide kinase / adenosylcobinamide-phosphate guanylyltransferase
VVVSYSSTQQSLEYCLLQISPQASQQASTGPINQSKMPATVYLVTGGARSGKSTHAELLCEQLSKTPIYLATASSPSLHHKEDEDFMQRIAKHQHDRQYRRDNGCSWTTIEEPLHPSKHADKFSAKVVLVDCMTLWLTNWMMEEGAFSIGTNTSGATSSDSHADDKETQKQASAAVDRAMKKLQEEFEVMTRPYDITYVLVTNEVGSGTHAETHIARKFVDAQGWCNQFVAARAQQVIHMICGMPHVLKNELDNNNNNNNNDQYNSALGGSANAKRLEAQRLDRHLSARGMAMDAKGYFLVKTDPREGLIVVSFHSCIKNDKGEICDLQGNRLTCHGDSPEPMKVWECRTAKEVTTEIFERWAHIHELELSVGHAAYVGREAQKAEFSLYHAGTCKFQQD